MHFLTSLIAATGANGQPLIFPKVDYASVFPELVLAGAALVLLLMTSIFRVRPSHSTYVPYTVLAGLIAVGSTYSQWHHMKVKGISSTYAGAIANDHFHLFFVVIIGAALILSTLVVSNWLERAQINGPEFYVLAMLSASGGMLMAAANDLIVVFLGLEILSLALYVLAGFNRRSEKSREAAVKYFVLGAFSSAVFLYGVALVYGATGSTNLSKIAIFLSTNVLVDNGLLLGGLAMLIVGFGFKVAAVPFHQWTPDVYEGSPSPITGFMGAAAKAAGFAAFIRVFATPLISAKLDWQPIMLALAVLTLFVGSVVACVQSNVKRMLAYSSISHAGYILLGLQVANVEGVSASLFYLLAYTFMVIGSFAVVTVVSGRDDDEHNLSDFRGLGRRRPVLALIFAVFLFAQAGVPLTSGFLAKFYVIEALAQAGSYGTAVSAMLAAAVAAFFYLRIVSVMYASDGPEVTSERTSSNDVDTEPEVGSVMDLADDGHGVALLEAPAALAVEAQNSMMPAATWIALAITVVFTIGLGVLPQDLINAIGFARKAAADLF